MPDLTQLQIAVLEHLSSRGYRIVAFPLYASAIGVRRESFAALLTPVEGGFRLLGEPHYLIDGNLSVQVRRAGATFFVWKRKSVPTTPDLLDRLRQFASDLESALSVVG